MEAKIPESDKSLKISAKNSVPLLLKPTHDLPGSPKGTRKFQPGSAVHEADRLPTGKSFRAVKYRVGWRLKVEGEEV